MTKINHRSSSLRPARGTAQAYDNAPLAELAFYDAKRHIGTSRNVSFGKRTPVTVALACNENCGHPGCRQGCTLIGKFK